MEKTGDITYHKNSAKEPRICMLILGEKGIGKKTFLNNLCGKDVFTSEEKVEEIPEPSGAHINPEIELKNKHVQLNDIESTSIDIVLFQGCGDWLDNISALGKIKDYLDSQFEHVLHEELRIKRNRMRVDNRCHVCIYFIRATLRGLREFDIYLMKQLGDKVNIIPVIAKADMLTEEELRRNRELIMLDIVKNEINIFDFKNDKLEDCLIDDSNFTSDYCSKSVKSTNIKDILPFALICGDERVTKSNGKVLHVRNYRWGKIDVEDGSNSDFIYLKNILLRSHLEELKSVTNDMYYENYRTEKLLSRTASGDLSDELVVPNSSQLTGSVPTSRRRNAFSVSNSIPETDQDNKEYMPFSKEMEEKNKIIKAYQQKIEALEKKLDNNLDDPNQKVYLDTIV